MFDQYARDLISRLPDIGGLDPVACRRALSRAYLVIVNNRILTDETADWDADQVELHDTLRRMVNALESVAIFDVINQVAIPTATVEACAFVAAEALALWGSLASYSEDLSQAPDPIQDQRTYSLMESALLYMVGGYDINAVAAIAGTAEAKAAIGDDAFGVRCRSGRRLWRRIDAFCRCAVGQLADGPPSVRGAAPAVVTDLMDDTRGCLYDALSAGLDAHFAWLRGDDASAQKAIEELARVRDCSLSPPATGGISVSAFSDVYHLSSLLLAAVRGTQSRSVVHGVPPPEGDDAGVKAKFAAYLKTRAVGTARLRGRPLLWPSTIEYVQTCLPGPHRDAVVSMPTGSGKSFLAELAVAHALTHGWVLYLSPTNALAHQIRRDLTEALAPFEDVTVAAFVGGAEYTALSDEKLSEGKFVAVMTPEKCALALRLYPEMFKGCSLCVFDECHLLHDGNRGAVADILLAQLFHAAPAMRVLLMSAMVSNADELAGWLATVRPNAGSPPSASKIKWRPSRAARGFVFLEENGYKAAREKGKADIAASKKMALTVSQELPLGWQAGLSGPWTKDGPDDYRAAPLPLTATFKMRRSRKGKLTEDVKSWKNRTGLLVAELLASRGLAAINFVLSSRHHAFGAAGRVTKQMPGAVGLAGFPALVGAQLSIADAELGVATCLRELLGKGIAVHTSAMLQVEQAASEWMFTHEKAKLMIATGTLAQGLNLPAAAVVVSGSELGGQQLRDLQDVDAAAGLTRANELILNGFGRAGRPGFANQGVVILISDRPMVADISPSLDGAPVIADYPVLAEPDASIAIRSPIEKFLDEIMAVEVNGDASSLEVALTALLSEVEGAVENAGTVLRRTFAGYRQRLRFTDQRAELARGRIAEVRARFLEAPGVPPWMPKAAMKAGVQFLRAQRMWEAYQARGLVSPDQFSTFTVRDWFGVLIEVLSYMPVSRVVDYLDEKATETPRTRLADLAATMRELDVVPWTRPEGWVQAWKDLGGVVLAFMQGKPFTEIGALLFGRQATDFDSNRSGGSNGLMPVFKFVGDVVDRALSQDAGCFLALHECWLEAQRQEATPPEALQALPLCIRNGADDLNVLAWFRFGYRQRMCAHSLASWYPVPPEVEGDLDRADAVRELRRVWLNEAQEDPPSLLDFARIVVREGSSDRN